MNILEKVKLNNPIAFTILKNAVINNKVAHAYLFAAPKNTVIENETKLLAQLLINENPFDSSNLRTIESYPDIQIIDGSEGIIKKEQVIKAAEVLYQTALDARGVKILIIKNIENGNKQSLNSLLKFIEEPTKNTFIIMTTNNLSQVISTIKSRAQVINLRPISQDKLTSEIENQGIDKKYSKVLATIVKNEEEAKVKFSSSFESLYNNLITGFKNAHHNSEVVITEFSSLIVKKDLKIVLPMIRTFLNDIWKLQQGIPISFIDEVEIIEKYSNSNFNFQEALIIVNDFIIAMQSHVNFELYKSQMLIKLRRCYG